MCKVVFICRAKWESGLVEGGQFFKVSDPRGSSNEALRTISGLTFR